ncbi:ABC transporter transmembrane domain-containing protein [Paeniglutamicibacter sp. NPDC091659]|uniref:ABC transporter transmembrane domain-containing protein n=1 Tax=Paeniglutamicibacter sp. NPDC091659 TaxID=3364389 RepID=UPI0037FFB7EE
MAPTKTSNRRPVDRDLSPDFSAITLGKHALRHGAFAEGRGLQLGASTALLMIHQVCEALVPVLIGVGIDKAIGPSDLGALFWILGGLAGLFLMLTYSWRHGYRLTNRVYGFGDHSLRQMVIAKVLDPRATGKQFGAGRTLNIATSDTAITAGLSWVVSQMSASLAALVTAATSLLLISWQLGLLVLVATAVFLVLMHFITAPLERRTHLQQERAAEATGLATDLVTGLRVLQGLGATRTATERYKETSRASLQAALGTAKSEALFSTVTLGLSAMFLAAITWVAASMTLAGEISIGQLVTVVGLAQFIQEPLSSLAYYPAALAQKRAAAKRIVALLNTEVDADAPEPATDSTPTGPAAFHELLVRGEGSHPDIRLLPGSITGLRTDARSSRELTLLLAGRADDSSQRVQINGVPAAACGLAALRSMVFVSDHDAAIFTGSIRENLHAQAPLDTVLGATGLAEISAKLPLGLDARVGEQGSALSGGQRQRLLLARALHQPQPVIVLVDPTTALDSVSEARIAAALNGPGSVALLIISDSPLLLGACDTVIDTVSLHTAGVNP